MSDDEVLAAIIASQEQMDAEIDLVWEELRKVMELLEEAVALAAGGDHSA